ncbi:MAG: hypothetical protein WBG43_11395 [Marinifilaceae bacterium]
MKNLITKLIITLFAIMFSLGAFSQTSEADQTGVDCISKGSQIKYAVIKRGTNAYKWIVNTDKDVPAPASCYTIVSGSLTSNKIEIIWNTIGDYHLTLLEKALIGTCKGRSNIMKVEVVDNRNAFKVIPLNKEFCADELYNQTLFVKLIKSPGQVIAYPIILKYTIDGIIGTKEVTFHVPILHVDLTRDLTLSSTRAITKGVGDEIITFTVVSIKDKYGADLSGSAVTEIIVHKQPAQSIIKHD